MTDKNLLQNKIIKTILKYINNFPKITLAYSGGMDSTVLLDILTQIYKNDKYKNHASIINFRAIHINHNLHPKSNDWAQHCNNECKIRGIQLKILHISINQYNKEGIEGAARTARYKVLTESLSKNEILITAHHKNDQVETFLLALKRGSGPTGLASMKIYTQFYNKKLLIRPLLNCEKSILKQYAYTHNLNFIEDDNNKNYRFDRNFLRFKIIPHLQKRWKNFSNAVTRSALICTRQEILLDELLSVEIKSLIYLDGSLQLIPIKNMNEIKRSAILRQWLKYQNIRMPSFKQLENLWKEVVLSKQDSNAKFKVDTKYISRFRNRLYVLSIYPNLNKNEKKINWDKKNKFLKLPANLGILIKNKIDNYKNIINNFSTIGININYNDYINFINNNYCNTLNNYNYYNNLIKNTTQFKKINKYPNITDKDINNTITLVRAPKNKEKISIRFESLIQKKIYINEHINGKKIKILWQEYNIPPWQRKIIPQLFYDDILIAIIGVFVTTNGQINKNFINNNNALIISQIHNYE